MILGSGILQASGWPQASDWLIRDEFTDTVAAGSVNGTAATPGPGTRTLADDASVVPVESGYIENTENANWNVRWLRYGGQARAAGLAVLSKQNSPGQTDTFIFGWSTSATPSTTYLAGIYQYTVARLDIWNAGQTGIGSALAANTWHNMAVVLRDVGMWFFLNVSGAWKLLWIISTGNTATMYPTVMWNRPTKTDDFRVIALPDPFDTDDGLATDVHSGSVAAGTTFSHEANALIEATITTVPSADNIDIVFRQQDASNYWICRIATGGDISLEEVVDGSETQRGLAAGVVSNGHRVVIIADDESIRVLSNNTSRISYGSAASAKTATAGEVGALGTGGAVSNLYTWPRTLSGTAAAILDKVSA